MPLHLLLPGGDKRDRLCPVDPASREARKARLSAGLYLPGGDKRDRLCPVDPASREARKARLSAGLYLPGGDKRDRTADLLNAIQALSQLSYIPGKERVRSTARRSLARDGLGSQGQGAGVDRE